MSTALKQRNTFNILAAGKVELGKNYLELLEPATESEFAEIFHSLSTAKNSSMWWIGDFLAYTEGRKGEAYATALENTDYSPGTLYNARWVCKSFPKASRFAALSYSHHLDALEYCDDVEEARGYLREASESEWSVPEMRKIIRKAHADPATTAEHVVKELHSETEYLLVLDSINTIKRYFERHPALNDGMRGYLKAEIEKLGELVGKHLR